MGPAGPTGSRGLRGPTGATGTVYSCAAGAAQFPGVDAANCGSIELTTSHLEGANLAEDSITFKSSLASPVVLAGADLVGARITGSAAISANFSGANLVGATFTASFANATFTGANLTGAKFPTPFTGATFTGALCPNGLLYNTTGANCP
jgi:uncharacterized protein YjbI with pentapeptide repeats